MLIAGHAPDMFLLLTLSKGKPGSHTGPAGRGHLPGVRVSPAGASFIGLERRTGQTPSEGSVRQFNRRGLVWSLCYLKALRLYNAKQVPFFFLYGSYIPPLYYCHAFFQPDS